MKRRGFLSALLGAATIDPEKLLWEISPRKLISIPVAAPLTLDHIFEISLERYRSQMIQNIYYTNQFLRELR